MPISIACADAHISNWSQQLRRFPTRLTWSSRLFHAAQLEVAVEIIKSGRILCRESVPQLLCDVANQGALWNNPDAHTYVRLYFWPKNTFHLKVEGIKSISDPNRQDPHMAIPVMFAFKLRDVMTLEDVYFVDGNFAKSSATLGDGDSDFSLLDFSKIYHDSVPLRDKMTEIHNARMSEVVVESELQLIYLDSIICRTIHEEATVRHYLRDLGINQYKIVTEQRGSIFMRKAIFVTEIYTNDNILHFRFDPPTSCPQNTYVICITCLTTKESVTYNLPAGAYKIPQILVEDRDAVWRVEIENCIAYEGVVPSEQRIVA